MEEAGIFRPPTPVNEPVRSYAPGSPERASLQRRLAEMARERIEMPLVIGGREVRNARSVPAVMPHDTAHVLGTVYWAGAEEMARAIDAARRAWPEWSGASWTDRAAVFLRAADLLAGPWRDTLNAATMLGQSKTAHQAEIDAACELCDFLRFNVAYASRMYAEQPESAPGSWNRMEYRPLEGFVLAVTPFNFTSIAGNLPTAPALMGATVVWKPSESAPYAAHHLMRLLRAAGLPDGVINLVHGPGPELVPAALAHPELAGVHFTGSTAAFRSIWSQVGENIGSYRNFPRLVGETGGKDFIVAHASAEPEALLTAIVRGSFEYQGQKCSAASRVFVPDALWTGLRERLREQVEAIPMGDVADFRNFMGAVINQRAFRRHQEAIAEARSRPGHTVLAGGQVDDARGWFVRPTVVVTEDWDSRLLKEELFGPIVTVVVYPEREYEAMLDRVDRATPYGLTGAVFATDRRAVRTALDRLRYTAGNVYVNDKPTGAVVGQQPFGGSRASGTNDKAGSLWNLARWVTPRAIKETFVPARDYRYPFMD
ncbi:MAG TPA: L-glutamate gamma-semialdehyde dehydrogenase [Candidatus Dormibacteraeota bacterium]|nr:L-glutamate gamma-semialdehyde dehydrogenase [Candidatus Dormibacteraeota bacterium]